MYFINFLQKNLKIGKQKKIGVCKKFVNEIFFFDLIFLFLQECHTQQRAEQKSTHAHTHTQLTTCISRC